MSFVIPPEVETFVAGLAVQELVQLGHYLIDAIAAKKTITAADVAAQAIVAEADALEAQKFPAGKP